MPNPRTENQLSNPAAPMSKPSSGRVVVFELDTNERKTSTRGALDEKKITPTYKFDINRWQRHVDVDIPANESGPEASVHIAKVQIPTHAYLGRIFGGYKEMWAVPAE